MSDFSGLLMEVKKPLRLNLLNLKTGLEIKDNSGEPMWLDLLAEDSAEGRAFDDEITDRNSREAMTKGKLYNPQSEIRQDIINRVCCLIRGWHLVNLETLEPIDAPFTPALAKELLQMEGARWIVDQAHNFLRNRANFFPGRSLDSRNGQNSSSS